MTHGKNKKNFEVFTAEEFIAFHHAAHPGKAFSDGQIHWLVFGQEQGRKDQACPELVEGAGFFRLGEEAAETERTDEVTVLDISDYQPPRVPSKTWRELIKKACARKGGYLGSGPSELSSMRP